MKIRRSRFTFIARPQGGISRIATRGSSPRRQVGLSIALTGCGGRAPSAPVKDLEFTQSMSSARVAFERGQMAQALLLFEQAMQKASARDDAADIGEAAYNLGVCLFDDGKLARAESVLETARIELSRANRRTNDVRLVQAKLARRIGKSAKQDAAKLAEEVATARDATPAEKTQAITLLAEIDLEAGRVDAAEKRAADARRTLPSGGVSTRSRDAMESGVVGLEARIALARGDHRKAAATFDRQASLAQSGALYGEMSTALLMAGQAYQSAGDTPTSADRLFRAARSLLAQGDRQRGYTAVKDAAIAAERAGNPELADRARQLVGEEVPTSKPATQGH